MTWLRFSFPKYLLLSLFEIICIILCNINFICFIIEYTSDLGICLEDKASLFITFFIYFFQKVPCFYAILSILVAISKLNLLPVIDNNLPLVKFTVQFQPVKVNRRNMYNSMQFHSTALFGISEQCCTKGIVLWRKLFKKRWTGFSKTNWGANFLTDGECTMAVKPI